MTFGTVEIMAIAITIAVWCIFLFGINVTS
jgi:hypothetical protein